MKKGILFLLIIISAKANTQSLKDALYGGKLKKDSGIVIRKTDDLSTKIDTTRKTEVETQKTKLTGLVVDSSGKKATAPPASIIIPTDEKLNNNVTIKDNNKIWKEYMDSVISGLKTEVLSSKKIKNGIYFILVDYEIGTDGQVTINNVSPSPENSFLQQQVKERLTLTAPQMNPLMSNGKPRKVVKKFNFTLNKM